MASYAVALEVTASAAVDLLRITPPVTGAMYLAECHITNVSRDTQEMVAAAVYTASTPGGAGTAQSVHRLDPGDPAFDGSAQSALSAIATKELTVTREGFSVADGFHYMPLRRSRPVISNGRHFVCRLESTPSETLTLLVSAVVVVDG